MQDHGKGMVTRESNVNFRQNVEAMQHDAAAAHALMQAIEDAEDRWFVTQKDHTDWIKKKADELMREWTNQSEV